MKKWKLLSEECIENNEWIDIRRCYYQLPNSKTYGPYYNFHKRNYTIIVPVDENNKIICVRQYRHGFDSITTEFPAGAIEESDYTNNKETAAMQCAMRELSEESGYTSNDWMPLITIPSSPTDADNYAYCFLARNCKQTEKMHLDETEDLNFITYTPQEIDQLIQNSQFQQPLHVMCWLLAKQHI